jgi:chemotaxis regulatin CheY-phosphate phosphatase CheZ
MDNLDRMNQLVSENKKIITALQNGTVDGHALSPAVVAELSPALDVLVKHNTEYLDLVTDTFTQMSFQDLTGQRLQRIIKLVAEIEEKITKMVISFGLKLTEREKNPEISTEELQKKVDEQVQLLAGPQKKGVGLDQAGIDDLLNSL